MKKIIFFILLIICFYKINSQNVLYDSISVDEFINKINDVSYDTEDYNRIIISLINSLTKYYIFVNITKNPPINIKAVDLINELKSINVSDIKDYLEFYNVIQNIMLKAKDLHLMLIFSNLLVYNYLSPVEFNVKTLNETNYLYLKSSSMLKIYNPFNKSLIKDIDEKKGLKILKINNQDPFDSIYNFYNQLLKDEHGSFSINLKLISAGNILFGFKKENFTNFSILFEDNSIIKFDYKMIFVKNMRKEFKFFYEKEIKKYYETSSFIPTIFEIEQKYNSLKKNSENRFLQNSLWDISLENIMYFKVDDINKVNVIYQNSFMPSSLHDAKNFLNEIAEKLSSNKYPIIVIESYNNGGYVELSLLLQKVLNYNLISNRLKQSFGTNQNLNKILDYQLELYNTETCKTEKLLKDKIYEDNFGNNVKHYRTQFYLFYNTKKLFNQISSKTYERKPTEIIIFTDGFSYSAASIFIKDLQESGNAIIVGYNGIPNEKRKKDKFNASQSPSMVIGNFSQILFNDDDLATLSYYKLCLGAPFSPSYNDKYQNDSILQVPREFTIELIDERSSIYGSYDDSRYDEFIQEGLKIFNKYKNSCNPNNTNLLYKSDCTIGDNFTHGGYECGSNGNWSNVCKPFYCDKGYYFDNYMKKCKKDLCYQIDTIVIVLLFIFAVIIVCIITYCIWNCYRQKNLRNKITGPLILNDNNIL